MSGAPPEPFGPEDFAAKTGVSRETLSRLKAYVDVLTDWNARHNLVSAKSLEDVWRRHVWDSAQLVRYLPVYAKTIADLGSGAGFPGLVLAELLRGKASVILFEATRKKADFLEAAAQRMGLNVGIRNVRIEAGTYQPVDVVTARALAPLDKLLGYAQQMAARHTVCLFLKGQSLGSELTEARKSWRMKALQHPSETDPSGVILEVRELRHV
ncbi:MAG: 16S rRNA (guanine(527)-N(7))-methyltransferase RsmG [Rhizomicrobium sp.]